MSLSKAVAITSADGTVVGYVEAIMPDFGDVSASHAYSISLDEFRERLRSMTSWVAEEIRSAIPPGPTSVSAEFGFKLAVETGQVFSVLAKAGAEANVSIKLEWDLRDKQITSKP